MVLDMMGGEAVTTLSRSAKTVRHIHRKSSKNLCLVASLSLYWAELCPHKDMFKVLHPGNYDLFGNRVFANSRKLNEVILD